MSVQGVAETQMLIKFVEKLPFTQKDKKAWLDSLHENGIDDEILEQVKEKYHKMPKTKFASDWMHAKSNMELTQIMRSWQMAKASKNFHHTR
jgi:hypothetical protein